MNNGNGKRVIIGMGTCGLASGANSVLARVKEELGSIEGEVEILRTGCIGMCYQEVLMDVHIPDRARVTYHKVQPDMVPRIIREHLVDGKPVLEYAIGQIGGNGDRPFEGIPLYSEIDFFKKQHRLVLRRCGFIDPDLIDDYLAHDGYKALKKALNQMRPETVREVVKSSGLRGRGGGGFPTGLKWEFCAKAAGQPKYLICNADEGDPGAFMDRSVLEGDPHAVIEGMTIAAFAIGARYGYIYCRAEYPLAIERLVTAIAQARERGFIGENILGTDFSFTLSIKKGAGAFVCGEETALMASIQGDRGMPRPRPPFPANRGLWDKPSNINNVETFACVPPIILNGADAYSSIGTEGTKGTKVFALTGKIRHTGLIEVPAGTRLKEIIYDIGGGIVGGGRFKAAQLGGPSGGCLPAGIVETPIDYDSLIQAGAMMGSGGIVIMDERSCMVDVARFFLNFTTSESCGKCVPCRLGTRTMLDILTRITDGEGTMEDLDNLEDLGHQIKSLSLCGLGQTAPNPVLSTLRYFREEYVAHIVEKHCPAVICRNIISTPCQHNCPTETDVPAYVALIALGRFSEALDVIRMTNPLPAVCGRVCHHPCEVVCRRADLDEPVSICSLKRVAADNAAKEAITGKYVVKTRKISGKGKMVGIIGAGPAGLTAASFLAMKDFTPVIFEAQRIAGGMLTLGVPEYRLPRDVLNHEIGLIESMGVKIHYNTPIGNGLSFDQVRREHAAVFIATGAHVDQELGIPGEDAEGVIKSLEFLRKINLGEDVHLGKRAAVVGGGNAAIDAARVARRQGAHVAILYRRTQKEMPADAMEVHEALREDVDLQTLVAPARVQTRGGRISGLICTRMELGEPDSSGRQRPIPIPDSEFEIPLDNLIVAIGGRSDLSFLGTGNGLETTDWNTIQAHPFSQMTNLEGVFAGGDVVTGPWMVIGAIAAGKRAAAHMELFLNGEDVAPLYDIMRPDIDPVEAVKLTDDDMLLVRPEMPTLDAHRRLDSSVEVDLGFSVEMAMKEARRCLRCDLDEKN
ncbi:MAG: NADH-ubiquinone oxidoreductase-F iron-sulfur binding region domain-containing protein [bacterium]|nr:NADH-ubiquinone oxidoreductase-F iron-sulfur binding region domain-containing protein [bacterium]